MKFQNFQFLVLVTLSLFSKTTQHTLHFYSEYKSINSTHDTAKIFILNLVFFNF